MKAVPMYHANEHSLYDPGRYRIISWNVNGLRQRHQMNQFLPVFRHNPDIVCVQETKITADRIPKDLKKVRGYSCYYDRENPDGFTQVVLYSKQEPESVTFGFGNTPFDREGRILIAEFETFTLMNLYFPLGIRPADTPEHKLAFYDAFLAYVSACKTARKNLIICGDFSIAHTDIDVARKEKKSTQRAGITAVERQKLDQLIDAGFSDTFRLFNRSDGHYSWWPNGFTREERRSGWRLDYFFVNAGIRPLVTSTEILACHEGSDHCPVMMTMNLPDQVRQEKQCAPAGVCRYHEGIPT